MVSSNPVVSDGRLRCAAMSAGLDMPLQRVPPARLSAGQHPLRAGRPRHVLRQRHELIWVGISCERSKYCAATDQLERSLL